MDGLELPFDADHQALHGEPVDHIEDPEGLAIASALMDEMVRPNMVQMLGPQPHSGAVVEPQPALLRLLGWNLQPHSLPLPPDDVVIDLPASTKQLGRDAEIAVTALLPARSYWRRDAPRWPWLWEHGAGLSRLDQVRDGPGAQMCQAGLA